MSKAIFFDIDGTLLDAVHGHMHITKKVSDALKSLQAAGHYIFIATGRPYAFLQKEILDFGFDGFIMNNGASVLLGDELIFHHELSRETVKKICDFAVSRNIEYMLESYPHVYCKKEFTACEDFFKKIQVDSSTFVRDFDLDKISVEKLECVSARTDSDSLDEDYKKILATPGFLGWADPFHYKSLEIYSDKISKGTGVLKILERIGVDVKNSYAFGDGKNDFEMIQTVEVGMAMATGSDEFKKIAKHVVPSVHEDGVAYGIENYILP